MPTRICAIPGCIKEAKNRRWCWGHYNRWRRHGDPEAPVKSHREKGLSMKQVFERELERAIPNGTCIEAVCARKGGGYPHTYFEGKHIKLARMAVSLKEGIPLDGTWFSLHSCDNRACISPEHLRSGTPAENVDDMIRRGRQSKGERHKTAKLTEANVREIRRALAAGEYQTVLAARFGVTRRAIGLIISGKTWRHI